MIGARSRCSRTLCYTTSLYVPYGRPRSKTEETGRDGEGSRDTSDSDVFVVVAVKGQTSPEYWWCRFSRHCSLSCQHTPITSHSSINSSLHASTNWKMDWKMDCKLNTLFANSVFELHSRAKPLCFCQHHNVRSKAGGCERLVWNRYVAASLSRAWHPKCRITEVHNESVQLT